jgi:uncharacterized protein YjbI with pentapeptide repeats
MISKIWPILTTDVKELDWKRTTEITKAGADAGKAVLDLAKAVQEKKTDLGQYVGEITSLLDVLNSPIASVIKETIPFAPIAVTLLQLIVEGTKREPTREECVALMSQVAYLDSLRSVLGTTEGLELVARLNERSVSDSVKQAIKKVGDLSLNLDEAEKVIVNFAATPLAKRFNVALVARLVDAGVSEAEAGIWAQRVAWNTPRFFNEVVAKVEDKVKMLAKFFNKGGREQLERYGSLDRYLDEKIKPLPLEKVFDETDLRFVDIYVPLKVQPLMQNGSTDSGRKPVQLEEEILRVLNDSETKAIVFLQGEAGQGKSVFCRMFSDRVRRDLYPSFTPILIRLRDLRKLANNLTETLEAELQYCEFVTTDSGWLTDLNQRFLFLLDGFDELLLQGGVKSGETGGLKEFLEQVERFQRDSHHRFVITGRPLSLQGIDRLISQSKNLARLSLCPMQDDDRNQWLDKWSVKFGVAERQEFEAFLTACPNDVNNKLAREPLLLYLLGRMHREKAISASDLQGASGMRAKVKVYDAAIDWVLCRQREDENLRITGLESDNLRRLLMEAALCVVQTGNETARVSMLEERLAKGNDSAIVEMIAKSRASADVSEQKTLNNLLTTFYIKPAAVDQEGSIEFAHKSFGEFLFAERLKEAIEDWSKPSQLRREKYLIANENFNWQIYDLLGYGGLTKEIVDYLMVMLEKSQEWQPIVLFERLNQFWECWCDGEFIDAAPENLPQKKMQLLREQVGDRETNLGLRQIDVYGGLNIFILLLSLNRYAQERNDLKDKIYFYPTGKSENGRNIKFQRLLKVIHYADCLDSRNFQSIVGFCFSNPSFIDVTLAGATLAGADLSNASLAGADLSIADLSGVDLSGAILIGADLSSADLSNADLSNANLSGTDLRSSNLNEANLNNADLSGADLSGADLSGTSLIGADLSAADLSGIDDLSGTDFSAANLSNVRFDDWTDWERVSGLDTAKNIPDRLKQQLNLP